MVLEKTKPKGGRGRPATSGGTKKTVKSGGGRSKMEEDESSEDYGLEDFLSSGQEETSTKPGTRRTAGARSSKGATKVLKTNEAEDVKEEEEKKRTSALRTQRNKSKAVVSLIYLKSNSSLKMIQRMILMRKSKSLLLLKRVVVQEKFKKILHLLKILKLNLIKVLTLLLLLNKNQMMKKL